MNWPDNLYSQLYTIGDWLRFFVTEFNRADLYYGHGTHNAWEEAVSLVTGYLKLPADINDNMLGSRLIETERRALLALARQRIIERTPVAYLTNRAFFAGLEFYVNEHVLIPRSPIAECIESGFEPWIDSSSVTSILDLCTGSGCIAIAASYYFPDAAVTATDISDKAISVAQKNVKLHDLAARVTVLQGDLWQALHYQTFDVIVSNPPYVSQQEYNELPKEYYQEPKLGLVAQEQGLQLVQDILKKAKDFLNPNGILIVEVGNSQQALEALMPDLPLVWISFERGGDGVFCISREALISYFK